MSLSKLHTTSPTQLYALPSLTINTVNWMFNSNAGRAVKRTILGGAVTSWGEPVESAG